MAAGQAPMPSGAPEPGSTSTTAGLQKQWLQIEEIFHRALELPEGERAARVAEWCSEDPRLRDEVLQLLAADSSVEQLIAAGPERTHEEFLRRTDGDSDANDAYNDPDRPLEPPGDPWIGRTLGAFRIESLLGRGGMGVVYRAERVSGAFNQTVAVKLLGHHLHNTPAIALFLDERQTLARLEHPHIARLLDGGITEEGFPYVVMEYVEGRRLDQACDDPGTTGAQILRWFLQLCDAVAYVHRNLILHRDLKPGNILVTSDGSVKLLDFGALKHLGPDSDAASGMTQAGLRPVTLRYASPEHIEGGAVSTASDVYSLGMILYRLVAGQLPSDAGELSIGGYLDRLRNQKLKPPSLAALASTESAIARRFRGQNAGDLDAIVAKAIRFEAESRYPAVSALAEDIWSILLHRPIHARQGNFAYRALKYYRRNRWPLLTAAAAGAAIAVGISAMQWQAHQAHLQQHRAERGVEEERKLVHLLLSDYFEQLQKIPGSVEAQRKAATLAMAYLDSLNRIATGSALELDTIRGYTAIGNLQGDPYEQNLGNVPEAIRLLNKAVDLAQARAARKPHDVETIRLLVSAQSGLGDTYQGTGDIARGEQLLLSAVNAISGVANDPNADVKLLLQASSVTDALGDVYNPFHGFATANVDKSMHYYLEANRYDSVCIARFPQNDHCPTGLLLGDYKIGTLVEDSDPELAGVYYRQGLDAVLKFPPELMMAANSRRLKSYLLARLALTKIKTGHVAEGSALFGQARELFLAAIAKDEKDNRARFDLVAHDTDLIPEYDRIGRERDAEIAANEALEQLAILLQRSPKNLHWQTIQVEDMLAEARVEHKLGNKRESDQLRETGTERALRLAKSKDVSPQALELAAQALLERHPVRAHSDRDAQAALDFARRAVAAFAKPPVEELLTLARAQARAGYGKDAARTARTALAALTGPVKSAFTADQVAEARELISGAPAETK